MPIFEDCITHAHTFMGDFLAQAAIVLILVVYAILLYRFRQKSNFLAISVLTIFASGTALYYVAFANEPVIEGPVTIFIRSMFDSLKLFFFEQELLEIEHIQEESPIFLDLFHLVYAAAMMTTVYAVIDIFAKRLMTRFTLLARPYAKYRHVFFGIDPNSVHLASLIKDEKIAFIEFPDPESEEKASIGHILHGISRKEVKKNRLDAGNIDLLRASNALTEIDRGEGVLRKIGLSRLSKHVDGKTSFYLLSDDVSANAECIRTLESDPFFRDKTIHVNQKQDGLTQQYEMLLSPTSAHFIYPSSLAANALARDASCHPVSVMDIPRDEDFCAKGCASGMEALVVGFGRIGQAVTRFIYEYMAVPGEDGNEAPCRIYVQDAEMDSVKGTFISSSPGAAHGRKLLYEQVKAGSGMFWDKLTERIDRISYIVLSLPDEEVNMKLGGEIIAFAASKRKNGLKKFKVFVRCHREDEERKALIKFFNDRFGVTNVIRTFGEREKIFTSHMIISDYVGGMDNESVIGAKLFIDRYFKVTGRPDSWDAHAELTRASKENSDYATIFKERRKLSQFASRYYFIPTVMALSSGYLEFESIPAAVVDNLARCEHMRFVASMEMAGYCPGDENDELRMVNSRMCPWEKLTEEQKEYYRKIINASLAE